MAAEGEDIYIDLKKLRSLLKRAQFLMDKADRIVYGTPTLENCTRAIEAFVLTYDFKEDRKHYARELHARVHTLCLDMDDIFEANVLKGTDEHTGLTAKALKTDLVITIGRIDKGVGRYTGSIFKGKTTVE